MEKMICGITDGPQYDEVMVPIEPPEYLDSVSELAGYMQEKQGEGCLDGFIDYFLMHPTALEDMLSNIERHQMSRAGTVFFSALAGYRHQLLEDF